MQKIVAKQGGLFGRATAKKATAKKVAAPKKSSSSGECTKGFGLEIALRGVGWSEREAASSHPIHV